MAHSHPSIRHSPQMKMFSIGKTQIKSISSYQDLNYWESLDAWEVAQFRQVKVASEARFFFAGFQKKDAVPVLDIFGKLGFAGFQNYDLCRQWLEEGNYALDAGVCVEEEKMQK